MVKTKFNPAGVIGGNLLAVLIFLVFVLWAELAPFSLERSSLEDGPIEYLTTILFGLAGICFLLIIKRSPMLKERHELWRYFFLICWALLMFVFLGEEISWGQRLFEYGTPESIAAANVQEEFNLHNLSFLEAKKYTMLSLMMLITGVILPLAALSTKVKRIIQKLAFPVAPLAYMGFFIFSYAFGKYYYFRLDLDASSEVRELLMAFGMFFFALHGALRPGDVFRRRPTTEE